MPAKANELGDFLRARRDQIRPEDVGLVPGGQRRAPGLRREELALLAGISAEYYLRLERGRAQHPSPQILDALVIAESTRPLGQDSVEGLQVGIVVRVARNEDVVVATAQQQIFAHAADQHIAPQLARELIIAGPANVGTPSSGA